MAAEVINQSKPHSRGGPLFRINEIAYIHPDASGCAPYQIGLPQESDVKIVEVIGNDLGQYSYRIIIGAVGFGLVLPEQWLVKIANRHTFLGSARFVALVDTELFKQGTVFCQNGHYMHADDPGVYISKVRFVDLINNKIVKEIIE